jgi:hypothetical protein
MQVQDKLIYGAGGLVLYQRVAQEQQVSAAHAGRASQRRQGASKEPDASSCHCARLQMNEGRACQQLHWQQARNKECWRRGRHQRAVMDMASHLTLY